MAGFEGDDETLWMNFENWKTLGDKEIEKIWSAVKFEFPEGASKVDLIRSETHKNKSSSYECIPPERIT